MDTVILIDFGSTFTKTTVVDLRESQIIFSFETPSTVAVDANIGLDTCFDQIRKQIGIKRFEQSKKLATSSAAGGLRMVVVGLTASLSIAAGKNAAFGAGAKIIKSYSGALSPIDIEEMESMNMEIILLCGGYEGGNENTVRHNAKLLAELRGNISAPIIYAGNSGLLKEVKIIFRRKHKELFVVRNIIPSVGVVSAQPSVDLIRNIFLESIVNMKGLGKVKYALDSIVMPTPAAVLEAGELLSSGCEGEEGVGPLMIIDIGGATTDIHTYCDSSPIHGAKIVGVEEPYAKRTVEGDLGMRESCGLTIREAGRACVLKDLSISDDDLELAVNIRHENIKFLPGGNVDTQCTESKFDQQVARYACRFAARRHSGEIEGVSSRIGSRIQRGKNLVPIENIIGTGGPIIHSSNPGEILGEALMTDKDNRLKTLLPASARLMIDENYVFYAAGMLKKISPKVALRVMKSSLRLL